MDPVEVDGMDYMDGMDVRRRLGLWLVALLCVLLPLVVHAAPAAVAELSAESWYTAKIAANQTGGCTLARGYAPHPVFVEGWKSDPNDADALSDAERASVVGYSWAWGDGSADTAGYCAAHVYEVPGTYEITLTVTFAGGATDTATLSVEVLEPAGYRYVSGSGSDSNDGLTAETAWRTATKVATVASTAGALPAGTRVVFADDSTYDLWPGTWTSVRAPGITFARSGTGTNRPIIRRVVNPASPTTRDANLIKIAGADALHVAWWGLEFDGLSADKSAFGEIFTLNGRGCSVLWHECRLVNGKALIGFSTSPTVNTATNCYVSACTGGNEGAYQEGSGYTGLGSMLLYAKCKRWAVINNDFAYSNNHILYGSFGQGIVIKGNQFRYPAFGRHAFRVDCSSQDFNVPAKNVVVRNNVFTGWIDPIRQDGGIHNPLAGALRYNTVLTVFANNVNGDQSVEWVDYSDNTVTDGETLLQLAISSHVRVRGNTFSTASQYQSPARIEFGEGKERRPLYDVIFEDNTITTNETRASGKGVIFQLHPYTKAAWNGLSQHTGLVVRDNTITTTGNKPWAWFLPSSADARAQLVHANTWVSLDRDADNAVVVGGVWNAPGTQSTLASWYATTGNEPAAGTAPELPPATPPAATGKRVGVLR